MVSGSSCEMVTGDDDKDGAPKKLIQGNNKLPSSSVTSVLSNYDLLVEILLRLPVLSLVLFKSVSKHWLTIITSPDFIFRHRSENPNLDPPSGLLIQGINKREYDFKSFDNIH
ncbi:SGNH hydrolase-type esterase domain-containing protein, partial [Tanacetum coccineum]